MQLSHEFKQILDSRESLTQNLTDIGELRGLDWGENLTDIGELLGSDPRKKFHRYRRIADWDMEVI